MTTKALAQRLNEIRAQRDTAPTTVPQRLSQTPAWADNKPACKRHSSVYCGCS